ncbi:hypothetical protein [Saccharibacillus alkalitolerans]|uniref:Uncharacterized protein n=1 Tax=Saccharibacillus alkalitolerans TaxID=2705290 RepID=A0ABX0F263_9BACL|nr:hypothetical protein [Saccharibacillus alkalitolerans]NGZ75001.1 hypothetical protein [Saccharibacillus alkalitolerans]
MRPFFRSKSFWIPTLLSTLLLAMNLSSPQPHLLGMVLLVFVISAATAGCMFGGILYILTHWHERGSGGR